MSNRKPTALKILQGNPGGKRLPANEPKPDKVCAKSRPGWLSDEAAVVWAEVVPGLAKAGLATVADIPLLAVFCEEFATYKAMLGAPVAAGGDGKGYSSAEYRARQQSASLALSIAKRFGMSPGDRSVLDLPMAEVTDELDAFVKKRGAQ